MSNDIKKESFNYPRNRLPDKLAGIQLESSFTKILNNSSLLDFRESFNGSFGQSFGLPGTNAQPIKEILEVLKNKNGEFMAKYVQEKKNSENFGDRNNGNANNKKRKVDSQMEENEPEPRQVDYKSMDALRHPISARVKFYSVLQ